MRRTILTVSQFGSLVLTVFGGFYTRIAPPDDSLKFWPGFASLVAGVVFIVVSNLGAKPRARSLWLSVFPAILLPVFYQAKYQDLTASYNQARLICGTEYTSRGREYYLKHPEKGKEGLIMDFGGVTTDIWTEESINHSRLLLGLLYSGAVGFLAFALLTGLEKLKTSTGP